MFCILNDGHRLLSVEEDVSGFDAEGERNQSNGEGAAQEQEKDTRAPSSVAPFRTQLAAGRGTSRLRQVRRCRSRRGRARGVGDRARSPVRSRHRLGVLPRPRRIERHAVASAIKAWRRGGRTGRARPGSGPRGSAAGPRAPAGTCWPGWRRRAARRWWRRSCRWRACRRGCLPGICTVDRSESIPLSALDWMGTPSTGKSVLAAATPARCAAPPAPAMITSIPRPSAPPMYSSTRAGVRCADITRTSWGMPSASSAWDAWLMVSQSDLDPMMIATSGLVEGSGMARIVAKRDGVRPSRPA